MQRFSSSLLAFQCSRPFFVRRAAFLTAECSLKPSRSLACRTSPYRRREEEGDWKREGKWWNRWERALQLTYLRFCLCAVTVFMWEKERVSNLQAEASYDRYKRKHRIQEANVVQSPSNGEQSSSSPPNNREQSSSSLPNNGGQSSSSLPNNGGQSSPPLPSSPNKKAKPFEPRTVDVQAVFIELEANCNTSSDRHGNRGSPHGNRDGRSKDSSAHVEGAEDKDEVKRRNGTLRMPSLSPALTSSSRRDNTGPDDEMSKEKADENQGGVWNTLSQMGQATSSFFSNSYDYLYSLISSSSTPSTSASSESQTIQKESSERQAKTEEEERGKGKEEEQAVIPHSAITADDTMESPKPQSLKESGSSKLSNDASSDLRHKVAVPLTTEGATDEINEKQFLEGEKSRGSFAEESPDPLVDGWEFVVEQNGCKVYSKLYKDTGLKQYRVIGAYDDITARDFLEVQLARHEDRKVWDAYALKLDTIDTDKRTGSEVIHWIMKYPFPMSSREYVFVRRAWVSPNEDAAVIISKAVDHPAAPEGKKYVRVKQYYSEMVIKPHSFVDELGFHFELTYFDDPGVYLPSSAVNWVSKTAMPDFLSKMHVAALKKKSSYSNRQHRSAV